ncbi:hypothetical protein [Alishewanella sp. SMS8]|uniref:hypothetical protein n=1 Tax=Alishewanella sp. SMS8 TaxID=2994676 RepID=UPI0027421E09|nr:hypothetical protein [Alishewanella sp. SMS8]MDP5034621.1 hypothetical protein [Alishewanella sp.]MDP5459934.1 hypothetical protein [Alishewanella sp. SMS8]
MHKLENHTILLACHAGSKIGLGHLSRISVAAQHLKPLGYEMHLLLQSDQHIPQAFPDYLTVQQIDFEQNISETILKQVTRLNCRLVIFDFHYHSTPDTFATLLKALHVQLVKTIAIDALAEYIELLTMLYTPSFQVNPTLSAWQQEKCQFGWDAFLLKVSAETLVEKTYSLLILTGGADTTNLGKEWLITLDRLLPENLTFHWVQGPFATAPTKPENTQREIHIHRNLPNLAKLMNTVTFAVTLYGISFYELLYYGVPCVVFSPYGNKDEQELNEISKQQLALVAKNEIDATTQLQRLISSKTLSQCLAINAQKRLAGANGDKLRHCVSTLLEAK